MDTNRTATISPVYLGHTAPSVGPHHKKSNSLVGFDPLLSTNDVDVNKSPSLEMALSGVDTPPVVDQRQESVVDCKQLNEELRLLASQIEKSSPKPAHALSPFGRVSNKLSLPWKKGKGHRKTKSCSDSENFAAIATIPDVISRSKSAAKQPTSPPRTNDHKQSPSFSSPMMQELWYGGQLSNPMESPGIVEALSMPSLAKPRPTSFLTGKEVIRTSEQDATEWQLSIPEKNDFEVSAKVCQFLETYRTEECLDLNSLKEFDRMQLAEFASGDMSTDKIADYHRPQVESLLECGQDIVQVRGHVMSGEAHENPNNRREFLVLERQRQLICVFRGTKAEQQGKFSRQADVLKLKENHDVSVFADRLAALGELEKECFSMLDQLVEENPFCDVVFSGHSYGAALATLAAYRYASARPEIRVAATVTGSPKLGYEDFRLSAHSLPNLKLFRVEIGSPPSSKACHVGHAIRIHPSTLGQKHAATTSLVRAYRFGDTPDATSVRSIFKRDRDVSDFVTAIESLDSWVKDFYKQDGAGVKGKDNEVRQVV